MSGKTSSSRVKIGIGSAIFLEGNLTILAPKKKTRLVIFAHGSGSSRLSPRNTYVAEILQRGGIGTLLFDLLTEREDENYETRFDIDLLTKRLEIATSWVKQNLGESLSIGYFGASTGAAAALKAAAHLGKKEISAVVSRGGRPDLAFGDLAKVSVPTLLIVGGNDKEVLELNRSALAVIGSEKKELVTIPGATHLFEEPGALDQVAKLATSWFEAHL